MDHERSKICFTTRHLHGLGAVRGSFQLREGEIYVASDINFASNRLDQFVESVVMRGSQAVRARRGR